MSTHQLRFYFILGLTAVCGLLTSCEPTQTLSISELKRNQVQDSLKSNDNTILDNEGVNLIDVVSQSTVPQQHQRSTTHHVMQPPSAQQLQYVGRYKTEMSCNMALFACGDGDVDYILNLLPDGSAHRSIVHLGKLYGIQSGMIKNYRKDFWSYDAACDQIVVHFVEGVDLIYNVDQQKNLLLALDKTLRLDKANNNYFANPYLAPSYAYQLKKM